MNDEWLRIASVSIIAAQLVLPLATGVPQLLKKDAPPLPRLTRRGRAKARASTRDDDDGARATPLEPLRCPQCQAPVPLLASAFPCPSCAAPVSPPAEYVAVLVDRARTAIALARAERVWRRSRLTTAWPVLWLARVCVVAWTILVVAAAAGGSSIDWLPGLVTFLAIILAIVQTFGGLALVSAISEMRRQMPAVPGAGFLRCDAASDVCRACGGAIRFEADRFAAVCGYCNADNYRKALAAAARDDAATAVAKASLSLLDVVRARDERRSEVLLFFGFMAIAEAFYAVVFTLFAGANYLGL